jgi:23S rRNA (pseudouridine1915-N3)-methyltransferase
MRVIVAAVGRVKQGPERELATRYRDRVAKAGRPVGITHVEVVEVGESKAREAARRRIEESIALTQLVPDGAVTAVLDETGDNLDSTTFAHTLRRWRDQGRPTAVFIIGGPDGLAPNLRADASLRIAFGAATWPHQMVRIMLLEQLYRAVTIFAGHPYHRV